MPAPVPPPRVDELEALEAVADPASGTTSRTEPMSSRPRWWPLARLLPAPVWPKTGCRAE